LRTGEAVKRNNANGFTLIETVISLMLLSFITMVGYQGLVFGLKQWRDGHEKMQFQYDYHQAIAWVRNKLGSSEKVGRPLGDQSNYLFTGTRGSVEFVARYDRTRRGGLYVSKLYYDTRDNSIYVSYYLHHPGVEVSFEDGSSERVVLLADVASIRFSYYGRKAGDRVARWHDNWLRANTLPRVLTLDIETADGVRHQSTITMLTSNNV